MTKHGLIFRYIVTYNGNILTVLQIVLKPFVGSREYANRLSSLFSMAFQEVTSTAADVVASARTMYSKILLKPQASFGVPLELIMKREYDGDEDAAGAQSKLSSDVQCVHVSTSLSSPS